MSMEFTANGMPADPVIASRVSSTIEQMRELATERHRDAPYTRAFFQASAQLLSDGESPAADEHRRALGNAWQARPTYTSFSMARNYQRSISAVELWRVDRDTLFPAGKDRTDHWYPALHTAVDSPLNRFAFNAFLRMNVNSNLAPRAAVVEQVIAISGKEDPVSIAEIGPSAFHIPKKLLAHRRRGLGFRPLHVMKVLETEAGVIYSEDSAMSSHVTQLVRNSPSRNAPYLGIDYHDVRDSMFIAKMRGSSFYLEELASDWRRTREFERLEQIKLPNMMFEQADAAQPLDTQDMLRRHPTLGNGADMGLMSFVAYEAAPNHQVMAQNMLDLLNPKGIGIIFDSCTINEDGSMIFHDGEDYSNTVAIYDKARPHLGWQTILRYKTGRAQTQVGEAGLRHYPRARELGILMTRHAA